MSKPYSLFLALAATALPGAALAYDKPPTQPPTSVPGSGGDPAQVPEPEQMALFGLGVAGLIAARRLHKRS